MVRDILVCLRRDKKGGRERDRERGGREWRRQRDSGREREREERDAERCVLKVSSYVARFVQPVGKCFRVLKTGNCLRVMKTCDCFGLMKLSCLVASVER
jgi:hypothetical protein